jgi:hypothetical protein
MDLTRKAPSKLRGGGEGDHGPGWRILNYIEDFTYCRRLTIYVLCFVFFGLQAVLHYKKEVVLDKVTVKVFKV